MRMLRTQIVSDLTGVELKSGIEISVFGDDWPTRHFAGAIEATEYALTESPNRERILQGLADRGIEVLFLDRDDPTCWNARPGVFDPGCSEGRCCK